MFMKNKEWVTAGVRSNASFSAGAIDPSESASYSTSPAISVTNVDAAGYTPPSARLSLEDLPCATRLRIEND